MEEKADKKLDLKFEFQIELLDFSEVNFHCDLLILLSSSCCLCSAAVDGRYSIGSSIVSF